MVLAWAGVHGGFRALADARRAGSFLTQIIIPARDNNRDSLTVTWLYPCSCARISGSQGLEGILRAL